MITESITDWQKQMPDFRPSEFSKDPVKYADKDLLLNVQSFRSIIQQGINPSPDIDSLARFGGSATSQHYVGPPEKIVRRSTALDMFVNGFPIETFAQLLHCKLFNGIGVYLDTHYRGIPWVMFHVDIRKNPLSNGLPLIWFGVKEYDPDKKRKVTKYYYPHKDPSNWRFISILELCPDHTRR